MFDFEKLDVYSKAKIFNIEIYRLLLKAKLDAAARNQLRRASLSIALNIAEGSGRNSKPDKRNFMVIARGSVFECVAILDILKDEQTIIVEDFKHFYLLAEELSKMLYAMIQKLS
ncbi:MAG TPA: four helix bundle protein [Cytophagaceae bacterium]|jgi:four helix bundle protein